MEESLRKKAAESADELSGAVLAYAGDAVYELLVRTWAVGNCPHRPDDLHRKVTDLVNAGTQAELLKRLLPLLSEEEAAVVRRGRNAKLKSAANHQSLSDYKKATGFEALIGWLYLKGREDRILELLKAGCPELSEDLL